MNNLPFPDPRTGVLSRGPLMIDTATQALYSNAASERFGHEANTTPTAAAATGEFELQTTTRINPNARNLTGGVQALSVGPLPEAFGVNYNG